MLYQALQQGLRLTESVLENLREFYANTLFLSHLFEFLDRPSGLMRPALPAATPVTVTSGIRLSGISFRYPDSEREVLQGLDLFVPAGRITVVVGRNRSGQITLIKLLCRFYDPTAAGSKSMASIPAA